MISSPAFNFRTVLQDGILRAQPPSHLISLAHQPLELGLMAHFIDEETETIQRASVINARSAFGEVAKRGFKPKSFLFQMPFFLLAWRATLSAPSSCQ